MAVLLLTLLAAHSFYGGAYIETSILKLLPNTEHDAVAELAFAKFSAAGGQQIILAIKHPRESEAVRGAKLVATELRASGLFADISTGDGSASGA